MTETKTNSPILQKLIDFCDRRLESYEPTHNSFFNEIRDANHGEKTETLQWTLNEMIQAEVVHKYVKDMRDYLTKEDDADSPEQKAQYTLDYFKNQRRQFEVRPNASTNRVANLLDDLRNAAKWKFLFDESFGGSNASFIISACELIIANAEAAKK